MNTTFPKQHIRSSLSIIIVSVIITFLYTTNAFSYNIESIAKFSDKNNHDIYYGKNKIVFYGVEIKEGKDSVKASYKNKIIFDQDTGLPRANKLNDVYIIFDFPGQGMKTLALPIFSGGASCCMVEYFITKTPQELTLTTNDIGRGVIDNKENIAKGMHPIVGIQLSEQLDYSQIKTAHTLSTPYGIYPSYLIVNDNGKLRLAKPGELAEEYSEYLKDEIKSVKDQNNTPDDHSSSDELYIDQVDSIAFYALMAGKSEEECVNILRKIFPKLTDNELRNLTSQIHTLTKGNSNKKFEPLITKKISSGEEPATSKQNTPDKGIGIQKTPSKLNPTNEGQTPGIQNSQQ